MSDEKYSMLDLDLSGGLIFNFLLSPNVCFESFWSIVLCFSGELIWGDGLRPKLMTFLSDDFLAGLCSGVL